MEAPHQQLDIRLATPADVDTVSALLAVQLAEHEVEMDPARLRAAVLGMLEDAQRGFVLLALSGPAVVGVACLPLTWTLEHGGLSAWLDELYVIPERREQGIGRTLLRRACAHARELGCAAIDLEVEESHARAANLYVREGFERHRRTRFVLRLRRR
jgi:ribosomal protein S18 acetylase RimI-like enzyme